MKEHQITIRADRLNRPLETCFVGRLSSAVFRIGGDIPDDIEGITVQIGRTADPDTQEPRENFTAAATEEANTHAARSFRCYLAPFYFPDVSMGLKYHIVGLDASGNTRWLGTGTLEVEDNPANGTPIAPDIIPADTYIRNPATGLYHKLTAEVNELGEIVVTVEKEGIER
jgi:hypothetical protein